MLWVTIVVPRLLSAAKLSPISRRVHSIMTQFQLPRDGMFYRQPGGASIVDVLLALLVACNPITISSFLLLRDALREGAHGVVVVGFTPSFTFQPCHDACSLDTMPCHDHLRHSFVLEVNFTLSYLFVFCKTEKIVSSIHDEYMTF